MIEKIHYCEIMAAEIHYRMLSQAFNLINTKSITFFTSCCALDYNCFASICKNQDNSTCDLPVKGDSGAFSLKRRIEEPIRTPELTLCHVENLFFRPLLTFEGVNDSIEAFRGPVESGGIRNFFTGAATFSPQPRIFPTAPKISDKNPALAAENLNHLTETRFFRQNTAIVGQKSGAADYIALIFAMRAGFLLEYPMRNSKGHVQMAEELARIAEELARIAEGLAQMAKELARIAEELARMAEGLAKMAKELARMAKGHAQIAKELAQMAEGLARSAIEPLSMCNQLFWKRNRHTWILNQHGWKSRQHAWGSSQPAILAKQLRLIMIAAYLPKYNRYFLATI